MLLDFWRKPVHPEETQSIHITLYSWVEVSEACIILSWNCFLHQTWQTLYSMFLSAYIRVCDAVHRLQPPTALHVHAKDVCNCVWHFKRISLSSSKGLVKSQCLLLSSLMIVNILLWFWLLSVFLVCCFCLAFDNMSNGCLMLFPFLTLFLAA